MKMDRYQSKRFCKVNFVVLYSILLGFTTACKTQEKLVYLQNCTTGDSTSITVYSPKYKVNDVLAITVSGADQTSVEPFNMPIVAYAQGDGRVTGTPVQQGYTVNLNGEINFPNLGLLKIAGLSREEATTMLEEKLLPYVKNPLVTIRIINYKVTVLGEVRNPGVVPVMNERITLLEALGGAGDLLITGERKNVLVVRESGGKRQEMRVDLTSNDLFKHPAYYLEQNDVIYVTPNKAKRNSSFIGPGASVSIALASLVITTISILTR